MAMAGKVTGTQEERHFPSSPTLLCYKFEKELLEKG